MKRCWIHIGMLKTGSTSVQNSLGALDGNGKWKFLKVGGYPNMGNALYAMFAPEPHKYHIFVKRGLTAEELAERGARYRKKLRKKIENSDAETFIISGEALSFVDTPGIQAMHDFLTPLFDEVRIIGYVRPPLGWRISLFQQHLKIGFGPLDFPNPISSYRKQFERFDEIFGGDRVLLRKFEPSSFPHGCIVADFCDQIGIESPERSAIKRVNESMSREACGMLYAFRKFGPGVPLGKDFIQDNSRIVAALVAMSGRKFKISNSLLAVGLEKSREDVRWMENRLGQSLGENAGGDGSEVTSEQDLMTIPRASCLEFAAKYAEIHGVEIPADRIPEGDPVDPAKVAELVEYCRILGQQTIQLKAQSQLPPLDASYAGSDQRPPLKCCWVHIGMHKTGSTSVQVNLAKAQGHGDWAIMRTGGKSNMSLALYAMFASEPHKFHLFAKRKLTADEVAEKGARYREKLRREILNCGAQTVIISGEALSIVDRQGIERLRDFLTPLFEDIRIIGYVRPPLSFRISIFQQHLKYSPCPLDFSPLTIAYQKKFAKFDKVFGKQRVLLRKFEPAKFPNGCIVADFCEQVGIRAPERSAIERVNEGLSREACGILYAYRQFGPGVPHGKDFIRDNNRIVAGLLALRGRKFKVSNDLLTAGIDESREDIRWMEARLGESLVEKSQDDGSDVVSEQDLLTIRRASCEEFAARFAEIHGVQVPADRIPEGDPVDPVKVAELVEFCRTLGREVASPKPRVNPPRKTAWAWTSLPGFSFLKKVLKGTPKRRSTAPADGRHAASGVRAKSARSAGQP